MPATGRRRPTIAGRVPQSGPPARAPHSRSWLYWLPAALAILLSLPCLSWPFLWDDFDFLVRAKTLHLRDLLPDAHGTLYRPLSREVYFSVVEHLGRGSVIVAHMLNAVAAAICVYLLVLLIRRFSGPRAGVVGGLIFSSAAAVPFLVGWISGIQDLLCILFALVAYHLYDRGRILLGTVAFGAAILSKETAVALVPALLVLSLRPGTRARTRFLRSAVSVGVLLFGWLAIHPWAHRVLTHHEIRNVNEYVAFRGTELASGLIRGLPSLVNLSWTREHEWYAGIIATGVLASILVIFAIRRAWRLQPSAPNVADHWDRTRILCVGLLTILGPFLLTGAFIAHWSPYYAGVSTLGLAMLVAPPLSRLPWPITGMVTLAFLWLGNSSRVAVVEPEVPAEHSLRVTAAALQKVEQGFKSLWSDLPPAARVYLYIQAAGKHGVYVSLYKNQPLKIWYDDPSIEVRDPMHLVSSAGEQLLVWISPQLEVFEIQIPTLRVRTSGPRATFPEYQKTLRAFALGLAGQGQIDRAVSILTGMPQYSNYLRAYDRRSAAALLYSVGREQEASQILSTTPSFHRSDALEEVRGLVCKPVPGIDFDEGALRAFEISPTDTSAVREVMRRLEKRGFWESADRFARRLLVLVPNDSEATSVRARALAAVEKS